MTAYKHFKRYSTLKIIGKKLVSITIASKDLKRFICRAEIMKIWSGQEHFESLIYWTE